MKLVVETLRKKIFTKKYPHRIILRGLFLWYYSIKERKVMEELYNYLSKADKVYLVEGRKKVSMVVYTIRDNNVFVYIWKMQERDNAYLLFG